MENEREPAQEPFLAPQLLMGGTDFLNYSSYDMDMNLNDFPLQIPSISEGHPSMMSHSSWLQGGPALDEIRSTFSSLNTPSAIAARKRKRSNRLPIVAAYLSKEENNSGSDEGYNGSVSENERSTESSSSEDDDDEPNEKRSDLTEPRLLLRKRRQVPPYSEIDDFGSEYCSDEKTTSDEECKPRARRQVQPHEPSILGVGGDVMAHILTFLEPPTILKVLTAPICSVWLGNFTQNSELWRVLCLTDPFKATVVEPDVDYRRLYTSFVQCLRYLVRMTEDSRNGRPLTVPKQSQVQEHYLIATNRNLHQFFSRARAATTNEPSLDIILSKNKRPRKKKKKEVKDEPARVTYGHSMLTQKLLGPAAGGGVAGHVELPWSCAIYSIVNWMVAFRNVEGIQILCLKALPTLLEDEQQRATAQQAGLTNLVLRGMVSFPNSSQLHTSAFHTIVLLARPMGGREGMLFHSTLVDSNGIFSSSEIGAANGKSGIAVLLDSMRRFLSDKTLQAMGCWSMVNIALVPVQKTILIKLGAIDVALKAMVQHDTNEEVQFRALFAMINLIIPTGTEGEQDEEEPASEPEESPSYEDVDADRIVDLVVTSMKNFYSNNSILNRGCLVLHNLSLNPAFHAAMLWSPRCYQMLEWCLTNCRSDPVLHQGALRTLQRLQLTLSSNEAVRRRFLTVLRNEQQKSLRLVQQEALQEHDAQE